MFKTACRPFTAAFSRLVLVRGRQRESRRVRGGRAAALILIMGDNYETTDSKGEKRLVFANKKDVVSFLHGGLRTPACVGRNPGRTRPAFPQVFRPIDTFCSRLRPCLRGVFSVMGKSSRRRRVRMCELLGSFLRTENRPGANPYEAAAGVEPVAGGSGSSRQGSPKGYVAALSLSFMGVGGRNVA